MEIIQCLINGKKFDLDISISTIFLINNLNSFELIVSDKAKSDNFCYFMMPLLKKSRNITASKIGELRDKLFIPGELAMIFKIIEISSQYKFIFINPAGIDPDGVEIFISFINSIVKFKKYFSKVFIFIDENTYNRNSKNLEMKVIELDISTKIKKYELRITSNIDPA